MFGIIVVFVVVVKKTYLREISLIVFFKK